jgi:hypothetical protein
VVLTITETESESVSSDSITVEFGLARVPTDPKPGSSILILINFPFTRIQAPCVKIEKLSGSESSVSESSSTITFFVFSSDLLSKIPAKSSTNLDGLNPRMKGFFGS